MEVALRPRSSHAWAAAQMMRCSEFVGVPGSGAGGSQPFRVVVAPAAAVAMDFHAHLNTDEVGGLLGGSYDEATATLRWAAVAVT